MSGYRTIAIRALNTTDAAQSSSFNHDVTINGTGVAFKVQESGVDAVTLNSNAAHVIEQDLEVGDGATARTFAVKNTGAGNFLYVNSLAAVNLAGSLTLNDASATFRVQNSGVDRVYFKAAGDQEILNSDLVVGGTAGSGTEALKVRNTSGNNLFDADVATPSLTLNNPGGGYSLDVQQAGTSRVLIDSAGSDKVLIDGILRAKSAGTALIAADSGGTSQILLSGTGVLTATGTVQSSSATTAFDATGGGVINGADLALSDSLAAVRAPGAFQWHSQTINSGTFGSSAATTDTIALGPISATETAFVHQVWVDLTQVFTGGSVTAVILDVGYVAGNGDAFIDGIDIFTGTGKFGLLDDATKGTELAGGGAAIVPANDNVEITATSTGDNLDQLTTGTADIYALWTPTS